MGNAFCQTRIANCVDSLTCKAIVGSVVVGNHRLYTGVAYGIWSAGGVAVTAIASRLLFGEPLTRTMVAGIVLIMAGVLLVELGSAH